MSDLSQCLHCGEQLQSIAPPWLNCPACSHAYLPGDVEKAAKLRKERREHAEIMACLEADRKRGKPGGSSTKSYSKDDKLKAKSLSQVVWVEDTGEKVVRQQKLEQKSEFLAVRGLPEEASDAEIREAIKAQLLDSFS